MAKKINYPYGVKSIILENNGGGAGGDVYLDGNSLVIPEQGFIHPVIKIDGVNYYHKHEFNLLEIVQTEGKYSLNVLTGEAEELGSSPCLFVTSDENSQAVSIAMGDYMVGPNTYNRSTRIFNEGMYPTPITYVSTSFTIVDSQSEVDSNTKICLPMCSAYYGFLSEDGKTFISYFNLKSDDNVGPDYVGFIKQGDDVIPLRDGRIPAFALSGEDKWKTLMVGDDENIKPIANRNRICIPSSINTDSTMQDIINLNIGISVPVANHTNTYDVYFESEIGTSGDERGNAKLTISLMGAMKVEIEFDPNFKYHQNVIERKSKTVYGSDSILSTKLMSYTMTQYNLINGTPKLPNDASSKTYVLKAVNGTLTWVEETAQ